MFSNKNIPLLTIFFLAFFARLTLLFYLKTSYFFYDHPAGDTVYYLSWAREIAAGDWVGSRTFFGLPLYPYYLAVLYRLFLGHTEGIVILQLILGSLNCILVYLIAGRLFTSRTGILAGVLCAFNFSLMLFDSFLVPVTLIIFLSLSIVYSILQTDPKKAQEWFIIGVLLGLLTLADGKGLILTGVLAVYFLINCPNEKIGRIKILMSLLLGFVLIIGPVVLRNKAVGGSWVLISAQSGLSFYVGNNADTNGIYSHPDFLRPTHQGQDEDQIMLAEKSTGRALNAAQVSRFWFSQGVSFIEDHPWEYLKLLGHKFKLFFTQAEEAYEIDLLLLNTWKKVLDFNPYFLICPLALLGIILCWRHQREAGLLHLFILSQLIFTCVFFLNDRHRLSILPFLIIFESCIVMYIVDLIKERNLHRFVPLAAFVIVFVLIFRPIPVDPPMIQFLNYAKAGPIYEKQEKFAEAETQYRNALQIYPHDTNTLYNLANTYALQKRYLEAKQYYARVLSLNPYQIDSLYNLAYMHEQLSEPDKAVVLYQQVLALQESSLDAHFRLAHIYTQRSQCDKAARHINYFLAHKPALSGEIKKYFSACP